jgi:hypothetical protein
VSESLLIDPTLSVRNLMREFFGHSPYANSAAESASEESMRQSRKDVEGWLALKLRRGKCSRLLVGQLAQQNLTLGVLRNGLRFYFEPNDIYAVIEKLEKGGRRGKRYRKGLLHGFRRARHSSISFLMENALRSWDQKVKDSGLSEDAYLTSLIAAPARELVRNGFSASEAALQAVRDIVYRELVGNTKGLFHKARGWLVYALHEGGNCYLTLAIHREADGSILDRLKPCTEEFEFLKEIGGVPKTS